MLEADDVKLVPELMKMTGLTEEIRKDRNVMKDLSKAIILEPNQTKAQIDKCKDEIKNYLSKSGYQL